MPVIEDKVGVVADSLRKAAASHGVLSFRDFWKMFDDIKYMYTDDNGFHKSKMDIDAYDTLDAASAEVCDHSIAIYSSLMAKAKTGLPSSGFFSLHSLHLRPFYQRIVVANGLNEHDLKEDEHMAVAREVTNHERDRVYAHALSI